MIQTPGAALIKRAISKSLLALTMAVLAQGCVASRLFSTKAKDTPMGPGYDLSNVFTLEPHLPATLKRVAVLPLTAGVREPLAEAGLESLQAVLLAELTKQSLFEIVPVSPEALRIWTGRTTWRAADALPPALFDRLHQESGCDAVLFAEVTAYDPYLPLQIGWKLKLVDVATPTTRWAVEEVFRAGDQRVANSARRYYLQNLSDGHPLEDSRTILTSPRRFAQYSVSAVLDTLPRR